MTIKFSPNPALNARNNVHLSVEELMTLRLILNAEVQNQRVDYYSEKVRELRDKMDNLFDAVMGFIG